MATQRVTGNLLEADRYYRIFKWINEEGANIVINSVLGTKFHVIRTPLGAQLVQAKYIIACLTPYNIKQVTKVKPFQSISRHSKNSMELGALCCLIYSQEKMP